MNRAFVVAVYVINLQYSCSSLNHCDTSTKRRAEVATLNRTHSLKYSQTRVNPNESEKTQYLYSEFRASASSWRYESEKPITQVAKDLGINVNTLHTWIGKYSRPQENDK